MPEGALPAAFARAGRLLLGHVPGQRRFVVVTQVVNLVARALWELALRRVRKGTLVRSRLRSGSRLELDLSERIQGQVALTGQYEPTLAATIAASLPTGGTFFDVGGNVGLVTCEVLGRMRGRKPEVHVFEPHPDNVAALRRNLALNPGATVEVFAAAVGAASGTAELGISTSRNESGWHRIVSENAGGPPVAGTVTVPVTTLDEYARRHAVDHVHVLKIDVEGLEAAVLTGAGGLLSRGAVDLVILEISDALLDATGGDARDLHGVLEGYGYSATPIKSTSPTRLIPGTRHLAPEDIAFRREARRP